MLVTTNFKKGIDLPVWVWMTQCPVTAVVSGGFKYDGSRYIYSWNSASIYRFDTWTNGWQFLATPSVGVAGQDMIYDGIRNVLISVVTATTWQVFNLNAVNVTIAGVVCAPWVMTTMTPILPTAIATGAFLVGTKEVMLNDEVLDVPEVAAPTGNTTTNLRTTIAAPLFYGTLVGLQVRVTSGAQVGQTRTISAVVDTLNLTVAPALPGALASGDTFTIECPTGAATATFNTTTLADTAKTWVVNKYTNWDVEILTGTGAGQRRRIASNTATVLTLATAVTGNPRTGPFGTAPDATSTYRIIPSTDFIYYATGALLYKLDIVASPAAVWTALAAPTGQLAGGGADWSRGVAPGHIYAVRGGTATIQHYDIGLNVWATLTTFGMGADIFSTGASMVLLSGLGKLVVLNDLTTQLVALDLATNVWEMFSNHPYIAGTAVEGKRIEELTTPDGIRWLYMLRTGGQECFRVAVEWM